MPAVSAIFVYFFLYLEGADYDWLVLKPCRGNVMSFRGEVWAAEGCRSWMLDITAWHEQPFSLSTFRGGGRAFTAAQYLQETGDISAQASGKAASLCLDVSVNQMQRKTGYILPFPFSGRLSMPTGRARWCQLQAATGKRHEQEPSGDKRSRRADNETKSVCSRCIFGYAVGWAHWAVMTLEDSWNPPAGPSERHSMHPQHRFFKIGTKLLPEGTATA